jgi:hypothetical protein
MNMTMTLKRLLILSIVSLGACQTVAPVNDSASETQAQNNVLVNSTEVFAVVNAQVNAVDLEHKAAEWGYTLKSKEKLDGLDMYVMTFHCPPGINPYDAVVELERLQPNSTVSVNHKYSLQLETFEQNLSSSDYADTLIK